MKHLYTRLGDQGETTLADGAHIGKDTPLVEALGELDELNAHIGLLLVLMPQPEDTLAATQRNLFKVGDMVARAHSTEKQAKDAENLNLATTLLEQATDRIESQLPPLTDFVVPGGTTACAQCHVCRTVCRRAERSLVAARRVSLFPIETLAYVNRLSDFLFALSRTL